MPAPELQYRDSVKLYKSVKGNYGMDRKPATGETEAEMFGLLVQVTSFQHGDGQDTLASASVLHLPPDDEYLVEKNYRIEGMLVSVSPYGAAESVQVFRISSVNVARDVLLENEVHNVECSLTKVAGIIE